MADVTGSGYDLSLQQAFNEFGGITPGTSPIGVTASYVSPRGDAASEYYTENDLVDDFAGMGEESIAGIQASLINAGLLETDAGFIAGDWGPTTQRAFSYILGMANRRGVTTQERETGSAWRSALAEFELNPLPKYPDAEAYLPPDFDSVANSITTMFRRGVNRDPQPYELKLLANTLYSEQQDVSAGGLLAGQYGNYSKENVQAKIDAEGLTQIDPLAGAQFRFEEIIADEKGRLGENVDTRRSRALMFNSLNNAPN